ncbi:hypothetical protein C0J50_11573 [Silurus asotus]|uniref:Coiled-coil domain-containing protein 158 n=1 Tax=Silurus asotus TaxID=30991 RepID=A0AAD5FEP1_SILAS|nr:hypothetical protein C0J50_11573 [Silurus asotus]
MSFEAQNESSECKQASAPEVSGSLNGETGCAVTLTYHETEAPPEFGVNSQHSCSMNSGVDVNEASWLNFHGRDVFECAQKDYSEQVSDLQKQLREQCEQHELQKFHSHQSIIKLKSKLKECQTEKDTLANLRLTESQDHAKLIEQLQAAQLELHLLKQNEGHEMMEVEDRVKTLSGRGEMMTEILQDVFDRLSDYEKCSGESSSPCYGQAFSPSQLPLGDAVEKAIQDLKHKNRDLQEKRQMVQRQMKDPKEEGQGKTVSLNLDEYKEKIKQLITSHEQKVAMLNEKLNSSQTHADVLQHQVEALQQQLQNQTLLHQSEMTDMESALSLLRSDLLEQHNSYKDKTELRQTAEELCLERQQRSELEQHSLGVQQLENIVRSLREQCQRHLDLQEQSSSETRRIQALLDERNAELPVKQQQVQQSQVQLQEAHTKVQALQTEVELLRLRLEDGKKNSELLMRPLVALQQERKNLTKQLKQLRLDNQQLRAALLEAELRLSAMEQQKSQQQAALSERTNNLHQLTLEKQQVMAELEDQCKKLDQLKEEQETSREEHLRKTEELQLQNSKLKAQRNNIRNDLEQTKITIKALQGADEHGLKIAFGIQKQITAKREQVDLLQSRVQLLEETTEKLTQMSDSFAECQEYIQKQQQEIMRLKLQHTLELKEGQNLRSTSARIMCERQQDLQATNNICISPTTSRSLPEASPLPEVPYQAHSAGQELNVSDQKCSSGMELRSLVKELHSVIDLEQSLDTSNTSSRSRKKEVTENPEGEIRQTRPSTRYK